MAHRQADFDFPASFAGLSISSFVAISRTFSGGGAEPPRAKRRAWWQAAAAGVCALLLLLCTAVSANAQSVSFLGAESTLNASAGGQGLYHPFGVAVDRAGDVFIADAGNNRVVEVPAGRGAPITLPASGLNNPQGVAVDGSGDVFIADAGNNRVVELPWNGTSYGTQTTLPFSGLNQPEGVAVDSKGNVFIGDSVNTRVVELPWTGTSYGAQTTLPFSELFDPQGVAVDGSGDVFVVDAGNSQVWELPWTGTSYGAQTNVPTPTGMDDPWGVAVDGSGNVFIADTGDNLVVEVPWTGTSYGAETELYNPDLPDPTGLAVDGAGDVFISDPGWNKVVEVQRVSVNFQSANVCPAGQTTPAPCSTTLTLNYQVTGTGSVTFASTPAVLTQGASNLDFTLASGSTCAGATSWCNVNVTFAPLAPGLRMGAVQLSDSSGNLLVTTMLYGIGQGPAIAFGPGAQTTLIITLPWGLDHPPGVAVDAAGDVFIADSLSRVVEIPAGGGAQTETNAGDGGVVTGVAVDGAGNFFASDDGGEVYEYPRYRKVDNTGTAQLALDGAGDLFVADSSPGGAAVDKVPWTGTSYGQSTPVGSGLKSPAGVAVDGAGNVFIGDTGNNRVVELPAGGGAQITVISSGLNGPRGVAVDGAGNVFIGDTGNNRVVELPAGGGALITVGSGLSGPYGVAVDAAGDVFIADTGNNRVVEVQMAQAPSLSFATTAVDATSTDSPQSVTAQNIGNQTLNAVAPGLSVSPNSFLQVPGPGNPSDCTSGFSLAPGASCNLSIDFTPQIAGSPLTGSATFTDNALNATAATQSVGLSGTAQGQAP